MKVARIFGVVAAVSIVAAPAWAGGPTAPEEWVGVWEIMQTIEDCDGGTPETDTFVESICPGDVIYDPTPDEETGIVCEGTVDATSFDLVCEAVYSIFDCRITITIDMEGERTGDIYTAAGTITTAVEALGEFCTPSETCQTVQVTATRTDPTPEDCDLVPARPTTWGEIKARYR